MISTYVQGVTSSLGCLMELILKLAMPLAVVAGFAVVAIVVSAALQGEKSWVNRFDWNGFGAKVGGAALLGLALVICWGGLSEVQPLAREDAAWRERAEATANPVPDAPQVYQYGPAAASLVERTYKRTINLPPNFLQNIGQQGVGALAPYLSDPSDAGVKKMADEFQQNGQNILLTREVTRTDEQPIPLSRSDVRVAFHRMGRRAFDAEFQGTYLVQNKSEAPINARISLPLPQAGTVRDLSVRVGGAQLAEPGPSNTYEWKGPMQPGETRQVDIRYRVVGARSWHYDLGSLRRRVDQFHLEAVPNGPARFLRASLQPTGRTGRSLKWDLTNVVTAQQIAIALPPDTEGEEAYFQALSAFPATMLLFVSVAIGAGYWARRAPRLGRLTAGALLFAASLGAAEVLANYIGPVAAVISAPLMGVLLTVPQFGARTLPPLCCLALVPAAFLSPTHSGLIVLILVIAGLLSVRFTAGRAV